MSRTPLIAGNWKMHGTLSSVKALTQAIIRAAPLFNTVDVLICPSFVHLSLVAEQLTASNIALGAQNTFYASQGAFTGEVSPHMLKDLTCAYVIIGHSERRTLFGDDLSWVAKKCEAALSAKLIPILCVGETEAERKASQTMSVIKQQLQSVCEHIGPEVFGRMIIAYEPIWAIGTGLTPTPAEAQAVHADIRQFISNLGVDMAPTMRILYGGSMKPENAQDLLAMPDIDGGLIGGASLVAEQFIEICKMATNYTSAKYAI